MESLHVQVHVHAAFILYCYMHVCTNTLYMYVCVFIVLELTLCVSSSIEPGILLMHHSMRAHPQITASLLDFLCRVSLCTLTKHPHIKYCAYSCT